MKNLVCFLSHIINEEVIKRYEIILNALPNDFELKFVIPTVLDNKEELKKLDNISYFYCKFDKDYYLNKTINNCSQNNLVYCEIYENYPDYDNYYFIEYDCLFNPNQSDLWNNFFNYYKDKKIDLLCCHLCKYSLEHKMAMFPISTIIELNKDDSNNIINDNLIIEKNKLQTNNLYFAFFVNCKLSNKLIKLVYQYYKIDNKEIKSFFEYVVPTIAKKNNLIIEDYDNKYTQFIMYKNLNPHFLLNCGSVSWYCEDKNKYKKNVFIHPIKC